MNNIDTIAPTSCTWASVSAIPSEQASLYTWLSFDCGENLTGGTITSITANNGGLVNNITINAQGNPQFDLTTPNSSSTRINIKGTDAGGNPFDKDRVVSFLNAAPTASDFSVNASAWGSVFVDFTPYINDSEDEKDLEIEFVTYPAGFYFGNHTTTDLTNVGIWTSPWYQWTAILTYRVKDSNGRYSNVWTLTITNISN